MFDDLRIRLRAIFRRRRVEGELDEELQHHLASQMEQYLAAGLSPDQAALRARLDFGGVDRIKEECRDARGVRLIDESRQDLRFGLRALWRHRLTGAAAIGTLALGIGVNAAVFAVVDWVLLRPLPYPAPHELVSVSRAGPAGNALAYSEFQSLSAATAFRASAAVSTALRVMAGPGLEPSHVLVARVSGDLFTTLGIHPVPGRGFDGRETVDGAPVVVVSHALWTTRFLRDPQVIGRTVTIDGSAHIIIGIMPRGLGYPHESDLWRPSRSEEREDDDRELLMIGRLRGDVSLPRARAEIATLSSAVSTLESGSRVEALQRNEVRDVRGALLALMASAGIILLMACANVAALLAARGVDRMGETAIHGALGASRGRLLRRLLTESLMLAVVGGLLGLVLGRWTLQLVLGLAPQGLPRLNEIALDGRVVLAGLIVTFLVTLAVGVAPALQATRFDLKAVLHSSGSPGPPGQRRGRRMLVTAQTAMAIVVTVAAGLLGRSVQHLLQIDHGFNPDRLLAIELPLRQAEPGTVPRLLQDLVEAAQAVPGVHSAGVALSPPTRVIGLRVPIRVEGMPVREPIVATWRPVTPRYFETVGIPLVSGRVFAPGDRPEGDKVAVANASFVREVLGGGPAEGRRVVGEELASDGVTIVGVVGDISPAGQIERPALYVSMEQFPAVGGSLLVRTDGRPELVAPALTASLRTVAPALAFDRIYPVAEVLAAGRAGTRFNAQIAAGFAAIALLLAAIGVYGLTAGEVSARWRELSIRLALGAGTGQAVWAVIRPGAGAVVLGVIIGLGAALGVGQGIRSLLHGVGPTDPPTLIGVPLFLVAAGLASAWLAALPVLRSDPAATLREE